jgi:hypothetical protein
VLSVGVSGEERVHPHSVTVGIADDDRSTTVWMTVVGCGEQVDVGVVRGNWYADGDAALTKTH